MSTLRHGLVGQLTSFAVVGLNTPTYMRPGFWLVAPEGGFVDRRETPVPLRLAPRTLWTQFLWGSLCVPERPLPEPPLGVRSKTRTSRRTWGTRTR